MGSGAGAERGGVERLPLAAGTQHEKDGIQAAAIASAGPAASEGMGIDTLRQQRLDSCPEVIGDAPIVVHGMVIHRTPPKLADQKQGNYSPT
jgi:hypothetical protein